jgi:hypothetical protein
VRPGRLMWMVNVVDDESDCVVWITDVYHKDVGLRIFEVDDRVMTKASL